MNKKITDPFLATSIYRSGKGVNRMVGDSIKLIGEQGRTQLKRIDAAVKAFNTAALNVGSLGDTTRSSSSAQQAHLDTLFKDLDDADFFLAAELSLSTIFKSINLDNPPHEFTLFSVVAGDAFKETVLKQYDASKLNAERRVHLEEAIELHRSGFYSGSVCVLLTVLEGIITEALTVFEVIERDSKGRFALRDKSAKTSSLTGMRPKLKAGDKLPGQLREKYRLILEKQFSSTNPGEELTPTRNAILHGDSLGYNTEKNSVLLLLWVATTIRTFMNESTKLIALRLPRPTGSHVRMAHGKLSSG